MDRGCWNFAIGEEKPYPKEATEKEKFEYEWRKQRCHTTIYQGIERKLLPLIRHTTDGKEAWNILEDNFEPVSKARLAVLIDEFFEPRFNPVQEKIEGRVQSLRTWKLKEINESGRIQLKQNDLNATENAYNVGLSPGKGISKKPVERNGNVLDPTRSPGQYKKNRNPKDMGPWCKYCSRKGHTESKSYKKPQKEKKAFNAESEFCVYNPSSEVFAVSNDFEQFLVDSAATSHFCCKVTRTSLKNVVYKRVTKSVLEKVLMDLWGPAPVNYLGGSKYFLSIIDDFSRKVNVFTLKNEDEVFTVFREYLPRVERELGVKLKSIRTDNGMKFCNKEFEKILRELGVKSERTTIFTPELNGVSELLNRSSKDAVRTWLQDSGLQPRFWAEALQNYVYTKNRCSLAYVHVPNVYRNKLQPKAKIGIFMGYAVKVTFKKLRGNLPTSRSTSGTQSEEESLSCKSVLTQVRKEFSSRKFDEWTQLRLEFPLPPTWYQPTDEVFRVSCTPRADENHVGSAHENELFAPYISEGSVNGSEIKILRDSGASVDIVTRNYVSNADFTGEVIWVKQPLDLDLRCLPLARVRLNSPEFGEVVTKAAIVDSSLDQGIYLLSNATAELLNKRISIATVNAVTTRSQKKGENAKGDGKARRIESGTGGKNEIEPEMQLREESLPPIEIGEGAEDLFTPFKITQEEFSKAQMDCGTLEECRERVNKGHEGFKKEKGLFFRVTKDHLGNPRSQLIVPKKFRPAILEMCHESTSAHLGVTKTKDRALKYYFWPNCVKDIENYVRSCDPCQRIGKPREKTKAPLKLVPVISEIFSKLNIDCVGPLPISEKNNRYLLTAMCMSSKYPDAIPIEDLTSITVINAMLNVFSRMGFPREIQCDWGTSFTSYLTTEFFDKFGIKVTHSSVRHPRQNPVESVSTKPLSDF
ncbi:Retrovirus-related Pol polyprotein like [Argiope bruennichi]|uniref:RNA-directed DNA polymerase n=1 Tax=Argiope bruennichi TaxID=94029 RepID=A0A8T0ECA4_ARGBR|nr:Retrovirus-related Pol polyprotein like [Argiope bruennichi]